MPHHTHSQTARSTAKSSKTACIKPFSGLNRTCCLIFIRQCLIFGHSQNAYLPYLLIYCNIGVLARFWQ